MNRDGVMRFIGHASQSVASPFRGGELGVLNPIDCNILSVGLESDFRRIRKAFWKLIFARSVEVLSALFCRLFAAGASIASYAR